MLGVSQTTTQMAPYRERFPIGTRVRVAAREMLDRFRARRGNGKRLRPKQLSLAGQSGRVREVGFLHRGDVLYTLDGIPGVWPEECLVKEL